MLTRTMSISLLNMAGASQRPNGQTLNCNRVLLGKKAVLGLASGVRGACQYLLCRSREKNQADPATISRVLSTHGREYGSFFVTLVRGLQSTQNRQSSLIFFGTMRTREARELVEGQLVLLVASPTV